MSMCFDLKKVAETKLSDKQYSTMEKMMTEVMYFIMVVWGITFGRCLLFGFDEVV